MTEIQQSKKISRIKNQETIRAIESAGYRNGFLPEAMKKMALVAVLNTSLSMVLIASLAGIYVFRPEPQSYAVSPSGRIIKMVPLDKNITETGDVGQNAIASFVGNAVVDSYSIDFLNWRKQLSNLSSYYTPEGYNGFVAAIEPLKDRVVEGRFITSVAMLSPPIIEKTAIIDGVMKFKIGVDITVGLESELRRVSPQHWHIEVIAQRVPFSVNPIGVAINSTVATIATGTGS